MGPQQRGFRNESQQTTQVGVGPQQREMQEAFLRTTQVGVKAPTKRNAKRISPSTASWGC
ncbi:hypothetical protein [Staphylococcus lugdunensis]|uniref:hypothetical protein n=1 Tax=Staphylococcus lugdunensis TaxID=28035 RepID=UPI00114CA4B7|nr:hypothetical protein [Staphylococcus lugdunensis]MCH8655771.1 hypothetical protein [Staphylococcus lugdunensis]MCH8667718.1 hypothetical protein [Staphylococcus lugdunensis]MCI2763858.1 hypothetical protein [Staphylococcus lugdunensis]MCI2800073.1 hypothetical protein [Staphylococcus lugdunensis]